MRIADYLSLEPNSGFPSCKFSDINEVQILMRSCGEDIPLDTRTREFYAKYRSLLEKIAGWQLKTPVFYREFCPDGDKKHAQTDMSILIMEGLFRNNDLRNFDPDKSTFKNYLFYISKFILYRYIYDKNGISPKIRQLARDINEENEKRMQTNQNRFSIDEICHRFATDKESVFLALDWLAIQNPTMIDDNPSLLDQVPETQAPDYVDTQQIQLEMERAIQGLNAFCSQYNIILPSNLTNFEQMHLASLIFYRLPNKKWLFNPKERFVILQNHCGLKDKEIANLIETSHDTVRNLQKRIRDKINRIFPFRPKKKDFRNNL